MSSTVAQTAYDTDAQNACDAITTFNGPIFVDLDETLYLRNSTEDFLDCARPTLLALVLLRILDFVKPWRWSGGEATRDVWRVRLITVFFPWTLRKWKRCVKELAVQHGNTRLVASLKQRVSSPIIVTLGFRPLVEPLITALGFPDVKVVSARLSGFADRQQGKLLMATEALGEATIRQSMVVTDSVDDLPLLQVCAKPLRVIWPEARYRRAFATVYLPGRYLTEIKRPREHYIVRSILQEDFAFWVLSSIAIAVNPVTHFVGLLFLLASFWVIYERGYVDNDLVAAKFEKSPKLSAEFWGAQVATPRWLPWIWAAAFSTIAVAFLRWPGMFRPVDMVEWIAVLIGTYLWFKLYNRYDKSSRVWMFAVLQFARSAAFLALVPAVEIGVAGLGAHILARWVPYFVYRFSDRGWPSGSPFQLVRLLFFLVLSVLLAITDGIATIMNWTAFGLLAWTIFRARYELCQLFSGARRLDRSEPPLP